MSDEEVDEYLINRQRIEIEQLQEKIDKAIEYIEQLEKDFEIIQQEHDRLDKRNNDLLEENKRLEQNNQEMQKEAFVNSIPKSVIREKIEELEKDLKEDVITKIAYKDEAEYGIRLLKSLLGGSNE